jgi:hypothetical protein
MSSEPLTTLPNVTQTSPSSPGVGTEVSLFIPFRRVVGGEPVAAITAAFQIDLGIPEPA